TSGPPFIHDYTMEQDKGEKVEPLKHFFNQHLQAIVEPAVNISVDEQMIGYKGTTTPKLLKQYMPNKPNKRGFKFWARCGVSGFVYEAVLCCGSEKNVVSTLSLPSFLRLCSILSDEGAFDVETMRIKSL
ncbi:unnamed protein product, partial [Didymodactylos carnosus]